MTIVLTMDYIITCMYLISIYGLVFEFVCMFAVVGGMLCMEPATGRQVGQVG